MTLNTVTLESNETASENTLALKKVWTTINAYSCPYNYNFHMHTTASDGRLTPEALIQQALSIGLQGLAITDHHTVNGFEKAKICLEERQRKNPHCHIPYLWTGIEITSILNNTVVHILGYGFSPQHPAMAKYLTGITPSRQDAKAHKVINSIHEAGGLVVLAHPMRYRRSGLELIAEAFELGIDGLEAYYAYTNPFPWHPSVKQTELVKQEAWKYNLFTTCGTDTHGSNLLVRL